VAFPFKDEVIEPIVWANSTPAMLTKILGRRHHKFSCLSCGMLVEAEERTATWWKFWWNNGPYHWECHMNPMIVSSAYKGAGRKKRRKRV